MPERHEFILPVDLITFLRGHEYAGLSVSTNHGTAYVLKAPEADLQFCRGPLLIGFDHELHTNPTAPVIRTLIQLHDQIDSSLWFETFINVADSSQRHEFASLLYQPLIPLTFFNERLEPQFTKIVWNRRQPEMQNLLQTAELYYRLLPPEIYDFDRAKALVIQHHPLPVYGTT